MTGGGTTSIEALAGQVVAQDVEAGRPGKDTTTWVDPTPEDGNGCCCWWGVLTTICLITFVIAGLFGYFTAETRGGTVTPVRPAEAVPVTPQSPETTTVPANPSYNGSVQMVVQTTRNGQQSSFQVPAQLQLGGGTFTLSPAGIGAFAGTVDPGFAVNATGPGGTLSGTLRDGTTQNLSLVSTVLGCQACPVTVLLTSPLSLAPTVLQGPPLAATISGGVSLTGPQPDLGGGGRQLSWPLVAAGGAAGAAGLAIPLVGALRHRRRSRVGRAQSAGGVR